MGDRLQTREQMLADVTAPNPDAADVARKLSVRQKEAVQSFIQTDYGWCLPLANWSLVTLLALEKRRVVDFSFKPTDFGLAVREILTAQATGAPGREK